MGILKRLLVASVTLGASLAHGINSTAIAPVLSTPANNAVDVALQPTLTWTYPIPDIVTAFHLQISDNANFTDTLFADSTTLNGSARQLTVGPLVRGRKYYWRMKAITPTLTSVWTQASFTTLPGAPVLVSLPAVDDSVSPLFQWYDTNAAADAAEFKYQLEVSTDASFPSSYPAPYYMEDVVTSNTQPAQASPLEFRLGPLLPSTVYHWRVKRTSPGGSEYSPTESFTTQAPPASQLVWLSPADGAAATGIAPILKWEDDSPFPSAKFHLMVAKDNSFPAQPPTESPASPYVFNNIVTGTQQVLNLEYEKIYYWKLFVPLAEGGDGSFLTGSFFTGKEPPGKLTLKAPADGATGVLPDQVFGWKAIDRGEQYRIQAAFDYQFTTGFKEMVVSDSQGVFAGLDRDKFFYWRARAENSGGQGEWSDVRVFHTEIAPPPAPVVTYPVDGATNTPIPGGFSWEYMQVDGWHIQVATDAAFHDKVYEDSTSIVGNQVGTEVVGLDSGKAYYWRLRGKNAGGVSEWSGGRFITMGRIPRQISPAFGSEKIPGSQEFKWTSVPSASGYALKVALIHFNNNVPSFETVMEEHGLQDTIAYMGQPLLPAHLYAWFAGAEIPGETSWSQYSIFTSLYGEPAAPVPSIPAQDSQGVQTGFPLFQWAPQFPDSNHGPAQSYRVNLSDDSAFSWWFDTTLSTPMMVLKPGQLLKSHRYYWRVAAKNEAGTGPWSPRFTFVTAVDVPGSPVLVAPLGGSDSEGVTLTLRWKSVAYAQKYAVSLTTYADTSFVVALSDTVTDTAKVVGPLLKGKYYFWSVTAINAVGQAMAFSNFSTLPDVPGKDSLTSPANGAVDVAAQPVLTWKPSLFAQDRNLRVYAGAASTPVLDTTIDGFDTSFAVQGLANDTKYRWTVSSKNRAGWGPASDEWSFTTVMLLPSPVTLVFPADGDTLPADTAKALWHAASPKVDRYWVAVSPDSAFTTQFVDTAVTDTAHLVRYSADAGTYWWKVKAHNHAGWGEFSPKRTFVLKPLTTGLPKGFALRAFSFAGGAELRYDLPQRARVRIRIFDFGGRLRAFPLDAEQAPGRYALNLPAFPHGLYFLSFEAGDYRRQQRFPVQ